MNGLYYFFKACLLGFRAIHIQNRIQKRIHFVFKMSTDLISDYTLIVVVIYLESLMSTKIFS